MNIHTLLVEPIYPFNVGASGRATANMGDGELHIIAPQCEIELEARNGAAGAQEILSNRSMYSNWSEFKSKNPNACLIAMTRRSGQQRKIFPLREGVKRFLESPKYLDDKSQIFLVFGREDDGLSGLDLEQCNMFCYLPAHGKFQSLNLAQAVLLGQHVAHDVLRNIERGNPIDQPAFRDGVQAEFPDEALREWLLSMGFQIHPEKLNAFETIKRTIQRGFPSQKELGTLEKAFRQSARMIKG